MDAPIRPPLSRTALLYDYHFNFPGGTTFTVKILSSLDPKALVQFSRTCKDFRSFVYSAQEIWKSHYPLSDYCYPPIEPDWRKAYGFLHNRITKKPEGNFFSGLPLDVKKIVFTFMDGRSLARLSGVSRHLYHLLDKEVYWKKAFIRDNNGYAPEITTWKKNCYRQGLHKRNIKLGNFFFTKHSGQEFLVYEGIRYQKDEWFIRFIDDKGLIINSVRLENGLIINRVYIENKQIIQSTIILEEDHSYLRDVGYGRYLTATSCGFRVDPPTLEISEPPPSNIGHYLGSATIFEKEKALLKLTDWGDYQFRKDFIIRFHKDVSIICLEKKQTLQTISRKIWIGLMDDKVITREGSRLNISTVGSTVILKTVALPESIEFLRIDGVVVTRFVGTCSALNLGENVKFMVLFVNERNLVIFSIDNLLCYTLTSVSPDNLQLKDHYLYGFDPINPNQIVAVNLKTQKAEHTFSIQEPVKNFYIFENFIFISSAINRYVFNRITGQLLYVKPTEVMTVQCFPRINIHSHIFYEYTSKGWEFLDIGTGRLIGKLSLPWEYPSRISDGNYLNKSTLINWSNPLPPGAQSS